MPKFTEPKLGVTFLWLFVFSQAFRDVYLGELFGKLSLYEIALLAFGSSAAVFGVALLLFKRQDLVLLYQEWRLVLLLNLTTMLSWLLYFKALSMVEPAAVNLAFCGVAPAAVLLLGKLGIKDGLQPISINEKGLHIALLAIVMIMGISIATGYSNYNGSVATTAGLGVLLAMISGFSITAEMVFAKRMNNRGASASAIVGVRFLLVTGLCAIMLANNSAPTFVGYNGFELLYQAFIFLIILIIPIYLVQSGIAKTTPLISGIICSLGPITTLALQTVIGVHSISTVMLSTVSAYTMIAISAAYISTRKMAKLETVKNQHA